MQFELLLGLDQVQDN